MPFRWTVNPSAAARMPASIALLVRRTHTSASTPGGTSSGRSSSRSMRRRCCARVGEADWKGEHVALGTNTDPYQWVEGRYRLMPGIWEALRDARQPVLGPDQVAAAAARPALMLEIAQRRDSARACRSRRSTRGRGAPPSRTPRIRAHGWRRSPSSTAPASPRACWSRR